MLCSSIPLPHPTGFPTFLCQHPCLLLIELLFIFPTPFPCPSFLPSQSGHLLKCLSFILCLVSPCEAKPEHRDYWGRPQMTRCFTGALYFQLVSSFLGHAHGSERICAITNSGRQFPLSWDRIRRGLLAARPTSASKGCQGRGVARPQLCQTSAETRPRSHTGTSRRARSHTVSLARRTPPEPSPLPAGPAASPRGPARPRGAQGVP